MHVYFGQSEEVKHNFEKATPQKRNIRKEGQNIFYHRNWTLIVVTQFSHQSGYQKLVPIFLMTMQIMSILTTKSLFLCKIKDLILNLNSVSNNIMEEPRLSSVTKNVLRTKAKLFTN